MFVRLSLLKFPLFYFTLVKLYTFCIICYNLYTAEIHIVILFYRKQVCYMPAEKELNINLFERLYFSDRLERVAKKAECEPVLQKIEFEHRLTERKFY